MQELEALGSEVRNSPCSKKVLIFDGTTWHGEVVGFLIKFWKSNSELVIKAIGFFHSDVCMDTKYLAGTLSKFFVFILNDGRFY